MIDKKWIFPIMAVFVLILFLLLNTRVGPGEHPPSSPEVVDPRSYEGTVRYIYSEDLDLCFIEMIGSREWPGGISPVPCRKIPENMVIIRSLKNAEN